MSKGLGVWQRLESGAPRDRSRPIHPAWSWESIVLAKVEEVEVEE